MISQKSTLLLTSLLIFSAASLVGWKSADKSPREDSPAQFENLSSRGEARPAGNRDHGMRNLRSQRVEQDRMRSAIEMARSLPASEIRAWLDQGKFNQRKGYAMTLFEKIAFERWSQEEPVEFLVWIGENGASIDAARILAIAEANPEAIGAALAAIKDKADRIRILDSLASASPEIALTEFRKLLPLPASEWRYYEGTLKAIMKGHPSEVEAMLRDLDGQARTGLENIVYRQKLVDDFDSAFDEIVNFPDGFTRFFEDYSLIRTLKVEDILKRLDEFPAAWKAKLASNSYLLSFKVKSHPEFLERDWTESGFSEEQSKKLTSNMFLMGVQQDPETSLPLLDQAGFSEQEKQQFLAYAANQSRDEKELAKLAASLTNPDDRAYFENLLAERGSPAMQAQENMAPADLLEKLTSSENDSDSFRMSMQMRNWTREQKEELMNSYHKLEGEPKTQAATFLAKQNRGFSPELRGDAIVHLLTNADTQNIKGWNQENSREAGMETSQHAVDLMTTDPGQATAWVASLPDSPTRLLAKQNLALNWGNYDPEAAQKWIATQPVAEREAITKFLKEK